MAVTAEQVLAVNSRSRNIDLMVKLSNELLSSSVSVRACDPIQVWEKHPIVSQYLEILKDKEISIAIDLAVNNK